jgi:hypothetical protein
VKHNNGTDPCIIAFILLAANPVVINGNPKAIAFFEQFKEAQEKELPSAVKWQKKISQKILDSTFWKG